MRSHYFSSSKGVEAHAFRIFLENKFLLFLTFNALVATLWMLGMFRCVHIIFP